MYNSYPLILAFKEEDVYKMKRYTVTDIIKNKYTVTVYESEKYFNDNCPKKSYIIREKSEGYALEEAKDRYIEDFGYTEFDGYCFKVLKN